MRHDATRLVSNFVDIKRRILGVSDSLESADLTELIDELNRIVNRGFNYVEVNEGVYQAVFPPYMELLLWHFDKVACKLDYLRTTENRRKEILLAIEFAGYGKLPGEQ